MAYCLNSARCRECGEPLSCARERLHKGFHVDGVHRWDEYGDVNHA